MAAASQASSTALALIALSAHSLRSVWGHGVRSSLDAIATKLDLTLSPIPRKTAVLSQFMRGAAQASGGIIVHALTGFKQQVAVVFSQLDIFGKGGAVFHVFVDEAIAQLPGFQPLGRVFEYAKLLGAIEHLDLAAGAFGGFRLCVETVDPGGGDELTEQALPTPFQVRAFLGHNVQRSQKAGAIRHLGGVHQGIPVACASVDGLFWSVGLHDEEVDALVAQALLQAGDEAQALALHFGLKVGEFDQSVDVAAFACVVGARAEQANFGLSAKTSAAVALMVCCWAGVRRMGILKQNRGAEQGATGNRVNWRCGSKGLKSASKLTRWSRPDGWRRLGACRARGVDGEKWRSGCPVAMAFCSPRSSSPTPGSCALRMAARGLRDGLRGRMGRGGGDAAAWSWQPAAMDARSVKAGRGQAKNVYSRYNG